MQQFQIPQFIEVEDKLFGPFTIKQFVYVVGGGSMIYLLFQLLPKVLAFIIGAPIALFALALAFYKVNGQTFIKITQAFISHTFSDRMFIWKKDYSQPNTISPFEEKVIPEAPAKEERSLTKLNNLSWSLNVLDNSNT